MFFLSRHTWNLILFGIIINCILMLHGDTAQKQKGLTIVPDTDTEEKEENLENTESNANEVKIHTVDSVEEMDATFNPQLVEALRKINDDPSYLKPKEGELVDLSQFQMDPEKLEEMIEIFDWIESQLPPDDPQQIQKILNNVERYIDRNTSNASSNAGNYSDEVLLSELAILPEFLHQVDNGVDFMKMNGVPILLRAYKQYNTQQASLHYNVLSHIMNVIGVATQNNPNAIQYVHQSHLVAFILDELNRIHADYKSKHIGINGELMNKLLFTLSAITRQNQEGLSHLLSNHGPKALYKCGKLLDKEMNGYSQKTDLDDVEMENYRNLQRALKKLLTMVSDIVVLNRNNLEYSHMFLNRKWCAFMIDKGLEFHTDAVLQFVNDGIERNYCVEPEMLKSVKHKLNDIVQQNSPKQKQNTNGDGDGEEEEEEEEEDYYDEALLTQSLNMLRYIEQNFETDTEKTEL